MDITNDHISKKQLAKRQSLMLHALGFVTGDPDIKIDYPYLFHPGLQIRVSEPCKAKWIYMMLPVIRGSLITEIKIAHHRTGLDSHVSLVRLVEQREPVSASVVHNDFIDKTIPATGVISSSCNVVVNRSLLLKVCMDFASADDMIELGSVEVCYIPEYVSLSDQKKLAASAGKQKEESLTGLFGNNTSLGTNRLSLLDLFFQKTQKKKISF